MRQIAFTSDAFKEYNDWIERREIFDRIKILVRDIDRDPFQGLGKPEPLKGNWKGYWSRRINQEHRLIYWVSELQITIVKCKGHY
jgi:toxin YoeB